MTTRLANERYKTKVVYESLNPRWQEQFEMYLYSGQSQELEISVWDRDQRSKDDFMGRVQVDLARLARETTHQVWLNLEDGAGKLFLLVTISGDLADLFPETSSHCKLSGTTAQDTETFLSNWDHSERLAEQRKQMFSLRRTFQTGEDVGSLLVKVYRAKGLYAADLGGSSDPFCVLELGKCPKLIFYISLFHTLPTTSRRFNVKLMKHFSNFLLYQETWRDTTTQDTFLFLE